MAEGGGGVQWRRVTVSSGRVKKGGCPSTPGVERDIWWGGEWRRVWGRRGLVGVRRSLLVGCRIRGGNFSARSTTDVCLRSELQRKLRGLAACGGWEKKIFSFWQRFSPRSFDRPLIPLRILRRSVKIVLCADSCIL